MIAAIFTLSGMLLFMLSVMVMDAGRAFARIRQDIEDSFGYDPQIFPDYEQD